MRHLQMVPRAVAAAGGTSKQHNGQATKFNSTMLGTAACFCGPSRAAGPRYVCVTCASFARIGRRIDERASHLYAERRAA